MPAPLLWICQAALAVVFAWAAVAKVIQWKSWRSSLAAYGIPRSIEPFAAALVPSAEVVVAALIVFGLPKVGVAAALAMLGLFSLAVVRARARTGDRLPCGCFGQTDARDYRLMLVRNALLGALAGTILVGGRDESLVEGMQGPPAGEVLPAILVAAGVLLVAWMLRHVTQLMRRREHM